MIFKCQTESIEMLKLLAEHQQHGVLIVGDCGSGKTYLARKYADFLGIADFHIVNPVISELKTTVDACIESQTAVVLCIENLDSGVAQAAYPLLKFIEDCPSYIYVVVTCCNLSAIPDTIPSRCATVCVNPPTQGDLDQYARAKESSMYSTVHEHAIWQCVKGFHDVDTVLQLTNSQLQYISILPNTIKPNESVSNISWKLTHFEDNTETPIVLVIRHLLHVYTGNKRRACLNCLNDFAENRMSKNAIVSKLIFDLNYT